MKIFRTKNELKEALAGLKAQNKTVTLVPTMGALHQGHISLIDYAKPQTDIIVCSIFVNPTQFNDPKDLEKYPRPIEQDIALLEAADCDILFLPTVEEMYQANDPAWRIDLGDLDRIWEGEHRPGHFQGVTQVVYKLFSLVEPDQACFGQKDFQQVMVIQKMIEIKELPVKLLICPIVRNENGLALSSRNARLTDEGRDTALILYKALNHIKTANKSKSPQVLINEAKEIIAAVPEVELEYLAICETSTLHSASQFDPEKEYVVLVAAWLEGVRLIDNILL
ncbi:pantoate--beta-alanine ligase [Sphingobacterium sp. UBA6645]|uniref:pantoate--beta-alanine ligase n=1 Tax=Sphingobacterium sp. UBA6645 TaxID=1947511 RepID=UPI0025F263AE|nr:pantoate--beta-alanine ligase [Sphingobacterium sp. UBA6645]